MQITSSSSNNGCQTCTNMLPFRKKYSYKLQTYFCTVPILYTILLHSIDKTRCRAILSSVEYVSVRDSCQHLIVLHNLCELRLFPECLLLRTLEVENVYYIIFSYHSIYCKSISDNTCSQVF